MRGGVTITRNQIDWQNMLISKSRAKEEARHNLATERMSEDTLAETQRANRAREAIQMRTADNEFAKLQEAIRSNKVNEYLNQLKHNESVRANLANEANKRLDISTQHMDKAEANRINQAFNNSQIAIKNLERLLNKDISESKLINEANKIAHDYEIAQGNLRVNQVNAATRAAATMGDAIKHVTQLFTRK